MNDNPRTTPPRFSVWLLHRCTRLRRHAERCADLDDLFYQRAKQRGPTYARLRYWLDVLGIILRPSLYHPRLAYQTARGPTMLQNYLKIAFRNFKTGYAFINVFGLAIGMACCLLILLYVQDELRFDRFHAKADRVFRVVNEHHREDGVTHRAATPPAMGPALAEAFPEIERAVRFYPRRETVVMTADRQFIEERGFLVDPGVFDVFSFGLLKGNPETALEAARSIVIAESMARRYFGEVDPMGRTLTLDRRITYEVTGMMADLPPQSHLSFSYLGSFATMRDLAGAEENWAVWNWQDFYTYVLLAEGTDPAVLEAKFSPLMAERADPQTQGSGVHYEPYLQPLTAIHLHSAGLENDIARRGSLTSVRAFSLTALFILFIACFNFVNLATARSARRAKEVGLRKVIGAQRFQLIRQFLAESTLLTFLSLLLAVATVAICLPVFNQFTGKSLSLGWDPPMIAGLLGVGLLVALAAGSYPAFVLSAFRPIATLKGHLQTGGGTMPPLRQVLVVTQFALSIGFISATLVVFNQLSFLQHRDLGFDKEQIVTLSLQGMPTDAEAFKADLLRQPGIVAASASWGIPGDVVAQDGLNIPGRDDAFLTHMLLVDADYVETYGMEIVAGRDFSPDFPSDEDAAFLLNETAARTLGWNPQEALGKELTWDRWGQQGGTKMGIVVGIVKDFNFQSLHQEVEPLVMQIFPPAFGHLAVRIRPDDVPRTLAALEQTWKARGGEGPFRYTFLDEQFAAMYASERLLGRLFLVFSVLAIVIACLGLFGLAALAVEQRTKEIGVRKVLGATVPGLIGLFSQGFLKMLGLAFAVATPVAYFALRAWLDAFAYRVPLGPGIFLLAGGLVALIALLTISYQAVKAATANPVKSLRYE